MKFMSILHRSIVGAFGSLALSLALPTTGHAVVFDLTADHCPGCGTGPYGTVDVTQVGTSVQVVVDLANGPPNTISWAQIGQTDFTLFKFNASLAVLSDIHVNQTFFIDILTVDTGFFAGDGTGVFEYAIRCLSCPGILGIFTNDIVFNIANATISDVTAPNSLGNIFAAGIYSSETGNTGPASVRVDFSAVPGPIAGAGLPGLLAMLGMGGLYWRRRQKNT